MSDLSLDEQLAIASIAEAQAARRDFLATELDSLPIECSGETMVNKLYDRNLVLRICGQLRLTPHGWRVAYQVLLDTFADAATWEPLVKETVQ